MSSPSRSTVESSSASIFNYTIHALPVELLLDIFATVNHVDSWTPLGYIYGHALAKLASVCRFWHTLVISTPWFWRRIELVLPVNTVSLFLLRSGGCTLDVRIFYSRDMRDERGVDEETLSLVLAHSHRIRSLHVDTSLLDLANIIPRFVEAGLPLLETMEVSRTRGPGDFRPLPIRGRPEYVDCCLTEKGQPRLQSLIAHYIRLPPATQFWRHLRAMRLHDYPHTASGPLSMDEFMGMLRMNRALEEVHILCSRTPSRSPLQQSDVSPPPLANVHQRPVVLPRLRIFSMHGEFVLFHALLLSLQLPQSVSYLDLRLSYMAGDEDAVLPAIQTFSSHVLVDRMSSVSLRGPYSSPSICSPPYAPADPELSPHRLSIALVHGGGTQPRPPLHSIQMLIDILQRCATVRRLALASFANDSYEPDGLFARVFAAFPSVEELDVSGTHALAILPALCAQSGRGSEALDGSASSAGGARGTLRCPMPVLRVLRVYAFCRKGCCRAREVAAAVEACARSRAGGGARLAELVMHAWVHYREQAALREMEDEAAETVERIADVVGELSCTYGREGLPWVPRVVSDISS